MKQFIILIIFYALSSNINLLSKEIAPAPHPDSLRCPSNAKYAYKVCCSGAMYDKCISDIAEYETNNPKCKVRRIPDAVLHPDPPYNSTGLPICVDMDYFKSYYKSSPGSKVSNGVEFFGEPYPEEKFIPTFDVFDTYYQNQDNATMQDILAACRQWNAICGYENAPCGTKIKVRFSDDPKYFGNDVLTTVAWVDYNYGQSSGVVLGVVTPNDEILGTDRCHLDLENMEIVFNNTREFTKSTWDKSHNWFFVNQEYITDNLLDFIDETNEDNPVMPDEPPYMVAFNFKNILMHELGHILGFAHPDVACSDEEIGYSIMNSQAEPVTNDNKHLSLSQYDKCAFKNLYCPQSVGINEYSYSSDDNNLYPNPSYDEAKLEFDIEAEYDVVTVIIQDNLGRILLVPIENKEYGKGSHLELIDVQSLPNGYYYCIIQTQRKNYVKPFVVIR